MIRTEETIRKAIEKAECARDSSESSWADFFEDIGERPPFTTKVCGVSLNCSECQEFDSFIRGLRYALGEEGDDID